jgi:hypothetical protein
MLQTDISDSLTSKVLRLLAQRTVTNVSSDPELDRSAWCQFLIPRSILRESGCFSAPMKWTRLTSSLSERLLPLLLLARWER